MEPAIQVDLEPNEKRFLAFVFVEVFSGGSTAAIQRVLGERVGEAKVLRPIVDAQADSDATFVELTERQWRVMYEALNAVIFGLGPTELQICTGQYLHEACNLNLRICSAVWGVYCGEYQWTGTKTERSE